MDEAIRLERVSCSSQSAADLCLVTAGRRGEYWARQMATGGQLRRLAVYRNAAPQRDQLVKDWSPGTVGMEILGRRADAIEIRHFWCKAIESENPSDEEICCFVTDALGAWRDVL